MKSAQEALDRLRWHERRLFEATIHFEDEAGRKATVSGAAVRSLDPHHILMRDPGPPMRIPYERVFRIDVAGGLFWLPPAQATTARVGPARL